MCLLKDKAREKKKKMMQNERRGIARVRKSVAPRKRERTYTERKKSDVPIHI